MPRSLHSCTYSHNVTDLFLRVSSILRVSSNCPGLYIAVLAVTDVSKSFIKMQTFVSKRFVHQTAQVST